MNKLETKHIAKHLPYGLIFQLSKHQITYGKIDFLPMNGLSIELSGDLNIELLAQNNDLLFSNSMNKIKPLLKPLSDLLKPQWQNFKGSIQDIPHYLYEYYLENHFDVDSLIDQGLAIDINTLEKDPYG